MCAPWAVIDESCISRHQRISRHRRISRHQRISRRQSSVVQIGRGKISLADAYLHSYQESKVPIVTPEGKHAGEVEIFFAFASKEVSDTPSKVELPGSCLLLDIFQTRSMDSAHYSVKVDEWCRTQAVFCRFQVFHACILTDFHLCLRYIPTHGCSVTC